MMLLKHGWVFINGNFEKRDVLVENGIIADISPSIEHSNSFELFELDNCFVFPGFADVHVHLREPGFSYKETIKTGTAAAARGGYTALCAMPNTKPVPDSIDTLAEMEKLICESACVDVYPYAAITMGENGGELVDFESLYNRVAGFSDDGRGVQSGGMMKSAMLSVKSVGGIIAAHCEDDTLLHGGYIHDGEYAKLHGHRVICSESEWGQVKRDIELVRETGCRYHVCHVSTKESVELVRKAKADGLPISCETGPHYLTLTDMDIQEDGRFKMNPPLRSHEDRHALIEGIQDGTIEVIATDHAPHSAEEKGKGLEKSLMGVVGLETAFPVLYTKLVKTGILKLEKLTELLCVNPRRIFGLGGGEIKVGAKADLAVFDLDKHGTINSEDFLSMGRATPFEGMEVYGESVLTVCGGKTVWRKTR